MDCSTCRDLMLEFVEGTLPAKVASGVAEHVKSCRACMNELEKQSSRTRVLQSLGRVKAPDQWDEIANSIRRTGPWYFATRYLVIAAIAGVVAAVVLIVAFAVAPSLRHGDGAAGATPGHAARTAGDSR